MRRGYQLKLRRGYQLKLRRGYQLKLRRGYLLKLRRGYQLKLRRGYQLKLRRGYLKIVTQLRLIYINNFKLTILPLQFCFLNLNVLKDLVWMEEIYCSIK